METIQKGFKAEKPLVALIEKIQAREHLNFSPLVKRIIWTYAEQNYPDLAEEAKKEIDAS
jgi:hypothetical protein